MAKAMLVIDMPECCADCQLATDDLIGLYHCTVTDNYYSADESMEGRDSSCPLRELPEKRDTIIYQNDSWVTAGEKTKNEGFNACLDEILKDGDKK